MDSSRILRGTGRWCEHISNVGMMTRRAPSCPGVTQRKNLRQAAMDSHDINGDHQTGGIKKIKMHQKMRDVMKKNTVYNNLHK